MERYSPWDTTYDEAKPKGTVNVTPMSHHHPAPKRTFHSPGSALAFTEAHSLNMSHNKSPMSLFLSYKFGAPLPTPWTWITCHGAEGSMYSQAVIWWASSGILTWDSDSKCEVLLAPEPQRFIITVQWKWQLHLSPKQKKMQSVCWRGGIFQALPQCLQVELICTPAYFAQIFSITLCE